MTITCVPLPISNVFLLQGTRVILVDTGRPSDAARIRAALQRAQVQASDVSLIVLTHGHWDHAGSARQLKEWFGAPLAVHRADVERLRAGHGGALRPTGWSGRLLRPIITLTFPAVEPDVVFETETDLQPYGVAASVVPTPGHTGGSLSVLTRDHDAIVGDLVMGGYLSGRLLPRRPGFHYFADHLGQVRDSLRALLARGVERFHTGHGGPLSADAVRRLIE